MSKKKSPDIRDWVDNEVKRVKIQNHRDYSAWYTSLSPHAKQVIDIILEEDVTPELITFAQDAPSEDWAQYQFLRVIGGGNPDPDISVVLTNFSLGDILYHVEMFSKKQ